MRPLGWWKYRNTSEVVDGIGALGDGGNIEKYLGLCLELRPLGVVEM